MSIKAGRVGVNPSQVNPVDGSILSSAISGYTKQEADAKFLTQTDAASTYESKTDASTAHNALQPKTLALPIETLMGTKLTVENALKGINDSIIIHDVTLSFEENANISEEYSFMKSNKIISLLKLSFKYTTGTTDEILLATIPEGYRPSEELNGYFSDQNGKCAIYIIKTNGQIRVKAYDAAMTVFRTSILWI